MSFSDKFKKDSSKVLEKKSNSFADRFGNKDNGEMDIKKYKKNTNNDSDDLVRQEKLYLVTGKDDGRDAWYYILIPKLREPLFLKDIKRNQEKCANNSIQ